MSEISTTADTNAIGRTSDLRIESVDLLRGAAIILMSLDHVREFLQAEQYDPLDLSQTTVALFFTRWVTHFCAPVFVFLAGMSVTLSLQAGRSPAETAKFLVWRGLWLVFLELTVVRFGWFMSFGDGYPCVGQVIWAIGWSMILLAPAIFLPSSVVTAIGILIMALHNLLDHVSASSFGEWGWLWIVLHAGGPIPVPIIPLYIAYPLLPWVGVMYAGFGAGQFYQMRRDTHRWWLVALGTGAVLLFVGIRATNFYGDPLPWSSQSNGVLTGLSFLSCQKYPPSLLFLLMTLGPALVLLGLCERPVGAFGKLCISFGRVPLFFYIVHILVIHLLAIAITFAQHGEFQTWLWSFPPGHAGKNCGVSLGVLYVIWIGVLAFHYPLCLWFGNLKRRYPKSWIRFL